MTRDTNISIQDKIINIVERILSDKNIDPKKYFFKEGDFVNELGVSRSTIREAVTSLQTRGYLKRVHGRGVLAIDRSAEAVSNSIIDMLHRKDINYHDVFEFRNIIEIKSAGIAASNRNKDNIKIMNDNVILMNNDVTYSEYWNADFKFHEEVIKATNNKMLEVIYSSYSNIIKYVIEMSIDKSYRPEINYHYHKKIMDAIIRQDNKHAEKYMEEHLIAFNNNIKKLNPQFLKTKM